MNEEEHDFGPQMWRIMQKSGRELPSPTDDLIRGGLTRGRRMKRRRQSLWAGAGLTVAAGLAGGAVFGGLLPGGTGGSSTAQPSDTSVTIPDFSLAAAQTSAPAGKTALTGKAAVATLKELLPGKLTTSGYQWWDGEKGDSSVRAGGRLLTAVGSEQAEAAVSVEGSFQLTTFDALDKDAARKTAGDTQDKTAKIAPDKSAAAKDTGAGTGKGKLRPVTKGELQHFYSCAARKEGGVRQTSCVARNLTDGSVLMSYEETSGTLVRRTSDVLRKDGTRIVITVSNSTDSKRGPADVSAPPLSLTQIAEIAESKTWQPWVSPSVIEGAKNIK